MSHLKSSSAADALKPIPADVQSLLDTLPSARPRTVPPERPVDAYFRLRKLGWENEAERILAHLITEKNGYVEIVRDRARSWAGSGHSGFDEDDLVQQTLLKMIEGLQAGQRSALNWVSFCYGRFSDARRFFNGRDGQRAIIEKRLRRIGDGDGAVAFDGSDNAATSAGDLGDGVDEEAEPAPPSSDAPESWGAGLGTNVEGKLVEQPNTKASAVSTKAARLEQELLEMFRHSDLFEQVADADLEAWGMRQINKLIDGIENEEFRFVAREQFCDDPRPLTGPPDDVGRPSVAAMRGWTKEQAKYRKKMARLYMAEKLLRLIDRPPAQEDDEAERAWLRTWHNKHCT